MKQLPLIEFFKRQMVHDITLAKKSGLSKELELKAKGMFFRQGLCNSNQYTGIFTDNYYRCADIRDPAHSLIYLTIKALSKRVAKENEYLIPVSDYELAAIILHHNNGVINSEFKCEHKNIRIGDKEIYCVHAKSQGTLDTAAQEQAIFNLLTFIAHWGALATQDKLIQILLHLEHNELLNLDIPYLDIIDDNIDVSTTEIIELLRQAPRIASLKDDDAKSYAFYCTFFERFVQGLYDTKQTHNLHIPLEKQLLYTQALRRLFLKLWLVQDNNSDYQTCMTALELAFDEVVNILALIQPYSENDLFATIKDFIRKSMALSSNTEPTSVSMAGSCMQIIHRNIISSLKYLSLHNSHADLKVFFINDMYYEICQAMGIEQDFEHNKLVTFRNEKPLSVQNYDGQIADLMLLHFHANVNKCERGFVSNDIKSIIQAQFNLRAQEKNSKQLIVVLDHTMTDLSGEHLHALLISLQEYIQSGRLAIILVTSLNKYCQIGFDRFPSGISAAFYDKEHFPNLTMDEIVGFEVNDVIPQTVTHFLRHAQSNVATYYNMVHNFSRQLHDKIIPKYLYDDKQPIHIEYPYTKSNQNNPWGFMVVRFAKNISAEYKPRLINFLNDIDITYRDGFGFNKSTYNSIGTGLGILRISIGPNASEEQYTKVVNFLKEENAKIRKHIHEIEPQRKNLKPRL